MKDLKRKVYMAAGSTTISLGPGRKEFHPKKPRPGLEKYLKEAGQATLQAIGGAANVDDCVIGNFMAPRFNRQGNLCAFFPMIDPGLQFKPAISVEGACASGGLALIAGIKSVLAKTADVCLVIGFEIQNTVKPIYGADILAGAGWYENRKAGHAYFFPGKFSDRAGAYFQKAGRKTSRLAFARWYRQAIENARLCPTAQEYHNRSRDPESLALAEPNPEVFLEHLTPLDCSKVSDGACAIAVLSEEGLKKTGIKPEEAVQVAGFSHVQYDITRSPSDLTRLQTTEVSVQKALSMAGITVDHLATVEAHDCFTIAGIMATEAIGLARPGEGADFVLSGHTSRSGRIPFNTTGGLIGWGHPTGATGVHQAVTILEQLTRKAKDSQIDVPEDRPFGLSVNMGGDDKTLVSIVYKRG